MANKGLTKDEAADFIEQMRKENVPSYHTAADFQQPSTGGNSPPTGDIGACQPDDGELLPAYLRQPTKFADCEFTEQEMDFIKSFLLTAPPMGVKPSAICVQIRREHHEIMQGFISALPGNINFSTYLDNVLVEHVRKYYPLMAAISKKCPPKIK